MRKQIEFALCILGTVGVLLGTSSPAEASGSGVVCTLTGNAGDVIECPLQLAATDLNQAKAAALQIEFTYPPLVVQFNLFSDGEFCLPGACIPWTLPDPQTSLQSGHSLSTSPADPSDWAGAATLVLANLTNPTQSLTDAYLFQSDMVGDPVFMTASFTLLEDAPANAPAQIVLNGVIASGSSGQPLGTSLEGSPAVIYTTTQPTGCGKTGNACDDGDVCTTNDSCISGFCSGQPLECDDDNPCTLQYCQPLSGCITETIQGACDDDDECTEETLCIAGYCAGGTTLDCTDDDACTDDVCDPYLGCSQPEADCDDGDVCTVDACVPGTGCTHTIPEANACTDPNPCTEDICDPNVGCVNVALDGYDCDDGNECTANESCVDGVCESPDVLDCDDANPCTTDYCHPAIGCVQTPNDNPCDDDETCTTLDTCSEGECVGGPTPNCDDGNACTTDSCSSGLGCVNFDANGSTCDDGKPCNGTQQDVCSAGTCTGPPCDCSSDSDCEDDGDLCNGVPYCHPFNKKCENGLPIICGATNNSDCTVNLCEPEFGVCVPQFVNAGAPCSDGDPCTHEDACAGGVCASSALQCDDENPCTIDTCDLGTGGCSFQLDVDGECDDGDACTAADHCLAGKCVGLIATPCSDGSECTDDLCDVDFGCFNVLNEAICEDGDACTQQDQCINGNCIAGTQASCDDDNFCTIDACDTAFGCTHPPLNCSDGDLCNGVESCDPILGCVPSDPPICADSDPCTQDACDTEFGCTFFDICGPGIFLDSISPTAAEAGVERTITVKGANFTAVSTLVIPGAEMLDSTPVDADEITFDLMTPAQAGIHDVTLIDGLWSQTIVDGFTVVDVPPPPPGGVAFVTPKNNLAISAGPGGASITTQVEVNGIPLEDGGASLTFLLDGVPQTQTLSTMYIFENVQKGHHLLTAQLMGGSGTMLDSPSGSDTISVKIVTGCSTANDCANDPCSTTSCVNNTCKYNVLDGNCCLNDATCPSGAVCAEGACFQCDTDADCVEGNTCTVDVCESGVCVHDVLENCCTSDVDCIDGNACTTDLCNPILGECVHQVVDNETCCDVPDDCDDSSACTINHCVANHCRFSPNPMLPYCCDGDSDCDEGFCDLNTCIECSQVFNSNCDDGDFCTLNTCDFISHQCQSVPIIDCCAVNADCDDASQCTDDLCDEETLTCLHLYEGQEPDEPPPPNINCCTTDADCNDGVPCNTDVCLQGKCRHGSNPLYPNCCVAGTQPPNYLFCTDNNPCTSDVCNNATSTCIHQDPPNKVCCESALECEDNNPATIDKCLTGTCVYLADNDWCGDASDCDKPCFDGYCEDSQCQWTQIPDCCWEDSMCYDGNKCTKNFCNTFTNTCQMLPVEGPCCTADTDCPLPEEDICMASACVAGTCRRAEVPDCCYDSTDCDDGNDCTQEACTDHSCIVVPDPACACAFNVDCLDGDPCTTDTCDGGLCSHTPNAWCCTSNSDCADSFSCTADACVFGVCKNVWIEDCCVLNPDCNDYDTCTIDSCADGECTHVVTPACSEPTGVAHSLCAPLNVDGFTVMNTPADLDGWSTEDCCATLDFPIGPPEPWVSEMTSPTINASNTVALTLQFEQDLPTSAGTPGDLAKVHLSFDAGITWLPLVTYQVAAAGPERYTTFEVPSVFVGQSGLRAKFGWEGLPASGGANWKICHLVVGAGLPPLFSEDIELPGAVSKGQLTQIALEASDEDEYDALYFTLLEAPSFATIVPTTSNGEESKASLVLTPEFADQGTHVMRIVVTDSESLRDVLEFTFNVQ